MKKKMLFILTILLLALPFQLAAQDTGAQELPFSSPLDTQEDLDRWEIFNRDDAESTWILGKSDNGGNGARSSGETGKSTSNWLVSPALKFKKGIKYEISFMVYASYSNKEKLRVTTGSQPEPEKQTVLKEVAIDNGYNAYYYGIKVSAIVPEKEADEILHVGIEHYGENNKAYFVLVKNFEVKQVSEGSINGKVVDSQKQPVKGAAITLSGAQEFKATTDADGAFSITSVLQGTYQLSVSAFGKTTKKQNVTIEADKASEITVELADMQKASITGKVVDYARNPIAGARVSVTGYANYSASTDATGAYQIDNVWFDYYETTYSMKVEKNNFEPTEKKLYSVLYPQSDVRLKQKNLAPAAISAVSDKSGAVTATITAPTDTTKLSYDNGTVGSPMGFESGRESNVLGVVYRLPASVKAVKWFTVSHPDKKPYVHVYIIDLDENGEPTGELLFSQTNVPTTDDAWTTFTLPNAVEAPRGFLLALSGDGNISLAKDDNQEILGNHSQVYSNTYNAADSYKYFEEVNYKGALMLRADVVAIEKEPSALAVNYDVFRFNENDKDDTSKWTQIATETKDLTVADDLSQQPRGTYIYAVAANYTVDNLESAKTYSNQVHYKQFTEVTVTVTANSDNKDAESALVTLKGKDSDKQYSASVTEGKAVFENVWKGEYTLAVAQPGFKAIEQDAKVDDLDSYSFDFELQQLLLPASNIDVVSDGNSYKVMWNMFANITDDFEGDEYADFEINPAGKTGWTYFDGDGLATYNFSGATFPTMGQKMAAVLIDGSKTEPAMTKKYATSGNHSLAFFAPRFVETEGGIQRPLGDDYLISPKLDFHKDFSFKFNARSYEETEDGLERIRIGYSTTGNDPEDFKWLSDDFTSVGAEDFAEFSYDIPKEARYVALNSSSTSFLLLVDDVVIGTDAIHSNQEASSATFLGYNLYFDDQRILTETNATEYQLSELTDGTHKAAVTKVYKGGESEKIEKTFVVENSGVSDNIGITLEVYVASDRKLHVNGSYGKASIIAATGATVLQASGEQAIDLASLPNGIYVAVITTNDNRTVTHKFLLK